VNAPLVLVCEAGEALANRLRAASPDAAWLLRGAADPRGLAATAGPSARGVAVVEVSAANPAGIDCLAWLRLRRPHIRVVAVTRGLQREQMHVRELGAAAVLDWQDPGLEQLVARRLKASVEA
jgi:hypothetical protein